MNFEGKTIINEGSRVIGLNDSDLERLSVVKQTANPALESEIISPDIPQSAATPETMVEPEVPAEAVVKAAPTAEVTNEAVVSDVVDAVKNEETTNMFDQVHSEEVTPVQEATAPVSSQEVVSPVEENKNIFDMPVMPESTPTQMTANPEVTVPNVDIPAINVANNVNNNAIKETVEPKLETPSEFETKIQEESSENEIVYLDRIKNTIITLKEENVKLKEQVANLENQLAIANQRVSIAESQRAAQVTGMSEQTSTLSQAA